jgi:CRISPR-associated protein Csb1
MASTRSYDLLKSAVAGSAAAFRLTLRLEPVSPKVFPPTYEGGKYATEERLVGGQRLPCVLLDSVPSQANRMELALQDAWEGGAVELPVITADFAKAENPGVPKVTSLQAPHRIADAILRDSQQRGVPFRKTDIGKQIDLTSLTYATPLLKHAPHCLVFGMWDSTGPRGGSGVKFARALVSEIVGVNAVGGVKTSSRIDPLNIRVNAGVLYKAKEGSWTLDETQAVKEKGKPARLGKEGKPSEANHGNVTPSVTPGGFTIDYAEQTTVLSLPALRRLRFPAGAGAKADPAADAAARTYLAALGLLGATLAVEAGYDLRSRCLLRAASAVTWELLGRPGEGPQTLGLTREQAVKLYQDALAAVRAAGLPVETNEVVLTPSDGLLTLVRKSMELASAETAGEGNP